MIHPGRSGPWITLGGGNEDGRFNLEANKKIFWDLQKIVDAKYSGVVFDIEETAGDVHELIKSFKKIFAECKKLNLEVGVTTSYSGPYQTDKPEDAALFVQSWAQDPNIDFMSPQMYTDGAEKKP